jgi:folate-binding protein YgfZ
MSLDSSFSLTVPTGWVGGACELQHWGVIRAIGPDARSFLHGQLTHDFALLGPERARLCGYCSPKGRLLATFVGFCRNDEEILLLCSRDVLAATLKRLSMFVLRAKVKLSDASDQFKVFGLAGALAQELLSSAWGKAPREPWQKKWLEGADLITLFPALGQERALWLSEQPAPSDWPLLPLSDWQALEVLSGVVQVQAATTEAFVPQMINHESVDGVSFKKGCYPGQEVVARSQFRGAIKRRGQLFISSSSLPAGAELFTPTDPSQPCGLVAQSAVWQGQQVVFASIIMSVVDQPDAVVQDAQGNRLQVLALPYPLRHDL